MSGRHASLGDSDADMAAEAMSLAGELHSSPPLVPQGGIFEGQVAILGETRIDGAVQGSLRGPGELVLGETANIDGVIDCHRLSASGRIMGPVTAQAAATLRAGTNLEGDVDAPVIEVEDGARWTGTARIGASARV